MGRWAVSDDVKEKSKLTKEEWKEYTKTVWRIPNTTHDDHPAVFPKEIPHRLIKLFSFHGERVLDPFAGTGPTAKAALPLGREAICVDINEKFLEIIRKGCASAENGKPVDEVLTIEKSDARSLDFLEDESVSLVVTSPPYWNKADYGEIDGNLGNVDNYRNFFDEIRPAFEECLRVLQPGRKLCLVTANVNQYTDHGLLTFPLAADFTSLLRDIGFVMISEVIWSKYGTGGKWGSWGSQRPIFGSYPYPPSFLFKNVHEYILIFEKPRTKLITKDKALPYRKLMGEVGDAS